MWCCASERKRVSDSTVAKATLYVGVTVADVIDSSISRFEDWRSQNMFVQRGEKVKLTTSKLMKELF